MFIIMTEGDLWYVGTVGWHKRRKWYVYYVSHYPYAGYWVLENVIYWGA
jgi:hypothetical protein